eukprot:1480126-Prymnesium_polylepis.2
MGKTLKGPLGSLTTQMLMLSFGCFCWSWSCTPLTAAKTSWQRFQGFHASSSFQPSTQPPALHPRASRSYALGSEEEEEEEEPRSRPVRAYRILLLLLGSALRSHTQRAPVSDGIGESASEATCVCVTGLRGRRTRTGT